MSTIKYIMADDHKIFRKGLRLALAKDHMLKCIGEAGNGNELMLLLQKQVPDVILLDLNMPGMGGKEVLLEVRNTYPTIKILILTMYEEDQYIVDLMEAGANGYLLKNAEPQDIKLALHTVYENEFYFSDLVSSAMLRKIARSPAPKPPSIVQLTTKETEVLTLICNQRTASEIAQEMHLSQRTIEGIRASLIEKTGMRNTAGLVVYAVKNGLVVY